MRPPRNSARETGDGTRTLGACTLLPRAAPQIVRLAEWSAIFAGVPITGYGAQHASFTKSPIDLGGRSNQKKAEK